MAVPIPAISRSEIDGIPAFSVDGPRPFTAVLEFRVGLYDERLPERGITHLVEHLALFAQREAEIVFNGSVGPHLTTFWAQGHPDEVGAFLRDVAGSIHDLPFDRLAIEAEVLQREETMAGWSYPERLLWSYFGPFGPGAASASQFGLSWLGPEEIASWATRHFTRDNAAIVIVGEPSKSWGLDLPSGEAVHYRVPERVRRAPEKPTLFETQDQGVTWAALMNDRKGTVEPELTIALEIISKRLQDRLRHDLGQTYSVFQGWQRLDEDHLIASHGFDADPQQSREVALEHHQVLAEFIENGPTQDEIDRYIRVQAKALEDHPQEFARHRVADVAEAHLQGWERTIDYDEWREACEATTSEAVRARFEEANRQSYTISDLPPGKLAPFEDVLDVAEEPMPGVQYRIRNPWRMPPNYPAVIRVGPGGISTRWRDGWMIERTADIAMVSFADGKASISASHTSIDVENRKYRKTRYWVHQPIVPWLAGGVALLLAVLLVSSGNAWPWGFATAALIVWAIVQSEQRAASLLKDSSKTMEDVARRFLPDHVFLPPPRSSGSD